MSVRDKLDIVVIDQEEACPYLPERVARMPLRMPLVPISPQRMDQLMDDGHRRSGEFIYTTRCPACRACEAIRIDCPAFQFSRNHRRVINRGNRSLQQVIGPIVVTQDRVDLFNRHRRLRGLARSDHDIDSDEYQWGFQKSCFNSFEIAYYASELQQEKPRLVCLGVCDLGATSLSAMYTFYDPDLATLSLGTYSILRQVEYCQQLGIRYLYLGYYVADSLHMQYKSRFAPHERLIQGNWVRFEQGY